MDVVADHRPASPAAAARQARDDDAMPYKRKRGGLEDFDPNKSDPDDENFDPGEDRPRKTKKRPRPSKPAKRSRSRRAGGGGGGGVGGGRYRGSDSADDDDEEDHSDSLEEDSFVEETEDDHDEDADGRVNTFGRKTRKAAARRKNYKETSDSAEDASEPDPSPRRPPRLSQPAPPPAPPQSPTKPAAPSKIVKLRVPRRANLAAPPPPPPPPMPTRRSTRARTEDPDELVQLSNSGHHAEPARPAKSKSPETLLRAGRPPSRASKGIKKPAEPVVLEVHSSSSVHATPPHDDDDADELAGEPVATSQKRAGSDGGASGGGDVVQDSDSEPEPEPIVTDPNDSPAVAAAAEEGDREEDRGDDDGGYGDADNDDENDDDGDDDEGPVTRRSRAARMAAPAAADADAAADAAAPQDGSGAAANLAPKLRRLTRRASTRKSAQEPSSDFEPGDESADGGESDPDSGRDSDNAADESPVPPRGRRGRAPKKAAIISRGSRNHGSADELELDPDELAEELHELRQDSRSRRRRRRPSSPIMYQEPKQRRSTAKRVDYTIVPLAGINMEEDEPEEPAAATAGPPTRRRGGASNAGWERPLNTTYGPFGGGGTAAILGGPWGAAAASAAAVAGADSDSSDDEMMHRSGNTNTTGMTPTTSAHPNVLSGFGQPAGAGLDGGGAGTVGGATPNVGRVKNQKALSDADPLGVDMSVDFSSVGGLRGHIEQLKEMVQLPLLYPELFQRFRVTPPRGVLFWGPPGTGKTLLARALANSASTDGRRITFYMRKGADALSKWVGEAEKQLRLLFEEARRTQPSIIFFDEIDGLAPVRSSKQEQIHASIVSTLLALMDGMDGRGQVIVIGATNRPDSIDPALRRPGRFDREFYFPLPDLDGRRSILDIHTREWGLSAGFRDELARSTRGCGGADLRAICTEAALNAIQRTYPQIYGSRDKLVVDPARITAHAADFIMALRKVVPSSERSAGSAAAPLPAAIEPLLRTQLRAIVRALDEMMPRRKKTTALEEAMFEPYDDDDGGFGRETLNQEFERSRVFRPRLVIHGLEGMGQGYLAAAALHHLEGVQVQNLGLPSLLADGRPIEQVIVGLFTEAKRNKPSVIFIPDVDTWFETIHDTLGFRTFQAMVRSIASTDPILVLATAESELKHIDGEISQRLFGLSHSNQFEIVRPSHTGRREFFANLIKYVQRTPFEFPDPENRKRRVLEELRVAPLPPPKPPSPQEVKAQLKRDHQLLNVLKVQLQPVMDQINRKYKKFRQPVIPYVQLQHLYAEADPAYVRPDVTDADLPPRPFEIVKDRHGKDVLRDTATGRCYYNLETTTIEERLSNGFYARPSDFLFDIRTLARDARNIGDKERTLKANELLSNVEVDVAAIETNTGSINWEAVYQRQLQRIRDAAEKDRRRRARDSLAAGNVAGGGSGNDSDSQGGGGGPVVLGEAIPGSRPGLVAAAAAATTLTASATTAARFQLKCPVPNGKGSGGGTAAADHHGRDDDVEMTGTGDDPEDGGGGGDTQEASQMRPPAPPPAGPVSRSIQVSQRSALTSLPPGVSPSAVLNEASTTKSSDPSLNRSSGPWSTQATNGGYHHRAGSGPDQSIILGDDIMPDTLLMAGSESQETPSSHERAAAAASQDIPPSPEWVHSQAHALRESAAVVGRTSSSLSSAPVSSSVNSSGSSSGLVIVHGSSRKGQQQPQQQARSSAQQKHAPQQQPQLHVSNNSSHGVSGASSQSLSQHAIPVDELSALKFLDDVATGTSGLTIEQLEQLNRELMAEVWRTRAEWNRNRVLDRLKRVFNDTIADIDQHQDVLTSSQQ